MSEAPNLRAMLAATQARLQFSLQQARTTYQHRGLRGEAVEVEARQFLEDHLPRSVDVGNGEVIDQADTRSGQMDIVISNEYQPFRAGRDESGLFLVEGVSAAGEAKSLLTTKSLDEAISIGTRFKALRSSYREGDQRRSHRGDSGRFYVCPPYFVLAFDSNIAPQTLIDRLAQASRVNAPNGDGPALAPVDAVFVLGRGWAMDYDNGQGPFQWVPNEGPYAGQRVPGWIWHEGAAVLINLLMWLDLVMPRVARGGPIIKHYLEEELSGWGTGLLPTPTDS
ncbi:DUF6602 domain-containing protein [Kitasatospora sp. NPDC004289]